MERGVGPFELLVLGDLSEVLLLRVELERDILLVAELFEGQMQGDLRGEMGRNMGNENYLILCK